MYFMTRAAQKLNKPINQIEGAALDRLRHYMWPGNIRELENSIERAVVLAEGDRITVQDLPPEILDGGSARLRHGLRGKGKRELGVSIRSPLVPTGLPKTEGEEAEPFEADQKLDVNRERDDLLAALKHCNGNKAEAARLLGLPRSTFFSRLKKHAIPVENVNFTSRGED